jgi:hypothetical protein
MIECMPRFGDALRHVIRSKLHTTIEAFATKADISTATLNKALHLEDGAELNPSTYKSISVAAGMTPSELDAYVESFWARASDPEPNSARRYASPASEERLAPELAARVQRLLEEVAESGKVPKVEEIRKRLGGK